MTKGSIQPTQRAFVKQLIVLFTIILALVPKVYADDDDWIDGITIRYKQNFTSVVFKYKDPNGDKEYTIMSTGPKVQSAVPITIEFKESLITSWLFRSAYIDWAFNVEFDDLIPRGESINVSDTHKYIKPGVVRRSLLIDSFFNSSDKEFTDANSNWALSADVKFSTLMIGYMFGFFYPANNGHRWFKLAYGVGIFANHIKAAYNLCSEYRIRYSSPQGECINKYNIDTLDANQVGYTYFASGYLWERKSKESIWRFFGLEFSVPSLNLDENSEKSAFGLKNHDTYFIPNLSIQYIDFFSYTYRF